MSAIQPEATGQTQLAERETDTGSVSHQPFY